MLPAFGIYAAGLAVTFGLILEALARHPDSLRRVGTRLGLAVRQWAVRTGSIEV